MSCSNEIMKKIFWQSVIFLLLIFLLFFHCRKESSTSFSNANSDGYTYQIPEQTNDGWNVASLHDVGINEQQIIEIVDKIQNDIYRDVHSVVIIKNGKLVFEKYFSGHDFAYYGNNYQGQLKNFNRDSWQNK